MNRRKIPGKGLLVRAVLPVMVGTLHTFTPARALAQPDSSAADTAAARTLAVEGVKLAQAGKCDEAVDKLERAEKLHHAPIVLASLGECKVTQGKLVEGTEMLRRVIREPLPDHPSPVLQKAYEHAQTTLDAAAPKIGRLTISVSVQGDGQPVVTVDGEVVPGALLGAERPTDPGEHTIEATAVGYLKASAKVTLGEGDKKSVKLEVERDPSAVVPAAVPETSEAADTDRTQSKETKPAEETSTAPNEPTAPSHSSANHTAAYISWIAGGAALAVGAGFGIAAMSGKSDLDKQCNGSVCPSDSRDKLDAAKRNGTIATIAFGVGAGGVALGTILFFTVGGSSEAPAAATSEPHRRHAKSPKLQAGLGLGSFQVAGEF